MKKRKIFLVVALCCIGSRLQAADSVLLPPIEFHAHRAARDAKSVLQRVVLPGQPWMAVPDCRQTDGEVFTDQETVLSAFNPRFDFAQSELEASEVMLSLPEGSLLRAVFDAEKVTFERRPNEMRLMVQGGTMQIIDGEGTTRVIVQAVGTQSLQIDAAVENEEVNLRVRGASTDGGNTPVRAKVQVGDTSIRKDAPSCSVGIHWKLLLPETPDRPLRLKMQWMYDLGALCAASKSQE